MSNSQASRPVLYKCRSLFSANNQRLSPEHILACLFMFCFLGSAADLQSLLSLPQDTDRQVTEDDDENTILQISPTLGLRILNID